VSETEPTPAPTVELDGRRLGVGDRAVYLPGADALVVADLHLGRDAASAVEFPLGERTALRDRLTDALGRFAPGAVVLAGDVCHRFDGPSADAVDALRGLTRACRDAGARPVLVAGNHDPGLAAAWDGRVHDRYRLADDTLVAHGHEAVAADAPLYVIGHDHPTIEIEGRRRPCLLYGPGAHRGGDLLVLPAFTPLAPGVAVNGMGAADFDSPLVTDADALRPVVFDPDADDALAFPPLGRFRRLL
jgi:metallophosphoesterase superfamily enzyme